MPRRELLTSIERLQLLAFPEDERELIRLVTLTKADLAFVRQHRGDHNRLGIAVLMSYLRYPGRVLGEGERPHEPVLNLVAEQLEIPIAAWDLYAGRDETRREHLLELFPLLGMEQFATRHYRALSTWLEPTALQTTQGILLARAVVEQLRRRLVVLPPLAVIERLCHALFDVAEPNRFDYRFLDKLKLRGKEEAVSVYEVFNGDEARSREVKKNTREEFEKGVFDFHGGRFQEALARFNEMEGEENFDPPVEIYRRRCARAIRLGATDEIDDRI
jgi:hypothetical protein